MMRTIYLLLAILFAVMLFNCGGKKEEEKKKEQQATQSDSLEPVKLIGIGRIEPKAKIASLYSDVTGVVDDLRIKAGDTVKKDQVIIVLTHKVEGAQLEQAQSKLATQAAQIEANEASYKSLQTRADNYKTVYERTKKIYDGGAETKQNLDNAQTDYQTALQNATQAQRIWSSSKDRLKELKADVDFYQVQYDRRFIKAPEDGTILTLDIRIGELIGQNTSFATFAPAGPTIAVCEIDELFAEKVKLGQWAYIRPQGMADTVAEGKVYFAAPSLTKKSLFSDQAGDLEDRRVREVRILLDDKNKNVLLGSRVECVIPITNK